MRTSVRLLPILALVGILSGICGIAQTAPEEEIDFDLVRANPVLREALSENAPIPRTTDYHGVRNRFRENWIDQQVDHFVKTVYRHLARLQESVQEAVAVSSGLTVETAEARADTTAALKKALAQVETESKRLRNTLSVVLVGPKNKDEFNLKVSRNARETGFQAEMALLTEQATHAERSIRDFCLNPTHVTSVTELKGPGMLGYLKRVERIAKAVREKL
ncbi:MAG TPA: hypothetical protein PLP42_05250 [Acidobacteriota bacterium]|nr:hypothetical protein [Acidobacteriota bacterium]